MKMTFRIALFIGVLILGLLAPRKSNAQSQPGKPERYAAQPLYEMAYDTLRAMLDGQRPISFKRAVFLTENAYLEGRLDWSAFDRSIGNLARFTDLVRESRSLLYDGPDSLEVQRNAAIFSVMMDSLPLLVGSDTVWLEPMGYDFQDFNGRRDWSQMFVSKLLESGKGNCHSLPFLYKILADETGAKAWLSMSPNHTYIKARTEKDGWYNTELTSGYFPHDAWIMASGYIHLDAIRNSLYLDTLSDREAIAAVMVDLATGYERKYGTHHPEGADFVLKACSTALEAYPEFANALLLRAETQRKRLLQQHGLSFGVTTVPPSLREDSVFQSLTDQYAHLHRLGYRRMPDAMYLDWLWSLKQNAESFDDQACPDCPAGEGTIRYRPPPNYEPDNPFKDLGYENEVLTLSKGKYIEDFDLDSLERIGGTVYNWQTGRIAGFVLADTVFSEYSLEPEIISRWLSPDPLADEFPGWSPYVYAANNPIMLVDRDGLAPTLPPIYDPTGSFAALRMSSYTNAAVFHSFETAQNSSLKHLQKFLWSSRLGEINYHKTVYPSMKGVVGEGVVLSRFMLPTSRDNVVAETFLRNMGSMGRGAISRRAAMATSAGYTLHPNKLTDLSFVARGTGFVHEFVTPSTATLGASLGISDPYQRTRQIYNNPSTKFIYEIKTNNPDGPGGELYTGNNIARGVQQLLSNPEVQSGAAIPVLLLDHDYFINGINGKYYDAFRDAHIKLRQYNGGIFTMEGLHSDTVKAIEGLRKADSNSPTKAGHYDYNP